MSKAALATAISAGGLLLLGNNNGGGVLNGLLGNGNQQAAATETALLLPLIAQMAANSGGGHAHRHDDDDRYVTKEVLSLVRENASKDAEIAELKSINYTNEAVKAATDPLNNRICNLETAAAVNAARDQDFRRYVNSEFVHQPKATMNELIVTCKPCGCDSGCDCKCG